MADLPACPRCSSEYTYEMGDLMVCPECAHEWSPSEDAEAAEAALIRDANGTVLSNGDAVVIVKDLKVKGAGSGLKVGTKVRNIRILEFPVDGHDLEAKVDGFGALHIRSQFVRKA